METKFAEEIDLGWNYFSNMQNKGYVSFVLFALIVEQFLRS
jgi:hypothetical protein